MKLNQLIPSVRREVEKPFPEKLRHAQQLIRMFANKNACVSCSFGKDSTVVLWLCLQENPNIPVVFNNTLVEFPETIALKEQLKLAWNLNLIETKPEKTYWQVWDGFKLPDGWKHNKEKTRDRCCYYLKEKPFKLIAKEKSFTHNYTGITALESRQRQLRICELGDYYYNKTNNLWRIHPIAFWTPEEVWQFIHDNNLPENLAYTKYKTDRIGCVPCTAHHQWREQLAKVNPAMYKYVQEHFFHQKLLEPLP
jgi:phosphoadenosine phosphosulfate reductase